MFLEKQNRKKKKNIYGTLALMGNQVGKVQKDQEGFFIYVYEII